MTHEQKCDNAGERWHQAENSQEKKEKKMDTEAKGISKR